ncbi:MAG: hypothetical protein ABI855_13130 [Bacteroidota bacterium]
MINKKIVFAALMLASISGMSLLISSCKTTHSATATTTASPGISCSGITPTYAADIKPIVDANCGSSCHSAEKQAHHLDLSTYETVKEESGKPEFLGAIKHEGEFTPMPKNHPKLDDSSIQKIHCWVQNGSPQ